MRSSEHSSGEQIIPRFVFDGVPLAHFRRRSYRAHRRGGGARVIVSSVAAVALNALILYALLNYQSEVSPKSYVDDGSEAVTVGLFRGNDRIETTRGGVAAGLDAIRAQADGDTPSVSPSTSAANGASLLSAMDQSVGQNDANRAAKAQSVSHGKEVDSPSNPWAHASFQPTKPQNSDHNLWPDVMPCWKHVPSASAIHIHVVLSSLGTVVEANPVSLSVAGNVNRLDSEAVNRAVQAIRACSPYKRFAGSGGVFEIQFPA